VRIADRPKNTEEETTAETVTPEEPGFFQRVYNGLVKVLSTVIETVAAGLVSLTEWGMDLLGIDNYR
jgi:hypothetical protein